MPDKPVEQRLRTMALPDQDGHRPWFWATLEEAAVEIERLKAIVDKLPKTADGVPVYPYMPVYLLRDGEVHSITAMEVHRDTGEWFTYFDCDFYCLDDECYSSREAAEAAKEKA